jgi:hypothetical protein
MKLRLFIGWLMLVTAARGAPPTTHSMPEELPSLEVRERRLSPPWRMTSTDDFVVLSQAPDLVTQQVVYALHRTRRLYLPANMVPKPSARTLVLIFNEPARYGSGIGSLRREGAHWVNVVQAVAADQEAFAINLHGADFNYSTTFRFHLFSLMHLIRPEVDPWVEEALFGEFGAYHHGLMAEPYGEDVPANVRVVRARWPSRAEAEAAARLLKDAIKHDIAGGRRRSPKNLRRCVQPLEQIFSAASLDEPSTRRRSAQRGLFAYWGLFAQQGKYAPGFWRFVEATRWEPVSEELFQRCFGRSFDEAADDMAWFLPVALHQQLARAVPAFQLPTLEFRDVRTAEVNLYRAQLAQLRREMGSRAGDGAGDQSRDWIRSRLQHASREGISVSMVAAGQGFLALEEDRFDDARAYLITAVDQGVPRPRVHLELAKLILTAERAATNHQTALAHLQRARALRPALPEVYTVAAALFAERGSALADEELEFLLEGVRLFPRHPRVTVATTRTLAHLGYRAEAAMLCERRLLFAPAEAERKLLNELRNDVAAPNETPKRLEAEATWLRHPAAESGVKPDPH